jgi:enamine deaminase RidA (YjgF/YER057c/UK114 family)
MYISGQIGLDVNTKALVEGGAVPEAEQVVRSHATLLYH